MRQIPIDDSPYQVQSFLVGEDTVRLSLRWNPVARFWSMEVYNMTGDHSVVQGVPLVVGVPLLWRSPASYFFWLTDESGMEMDPMVQSDLSGRCLLFVGLKSEIAA